MPVRGTHETNSVEQSSYPASTKAIQDISRVLWYLEVQYRIHKNMSAVPIPSQINPFHALPSDFLKVHFNIAHLHLGLPNVLFLSCFPTKPCIHLSSPAIRATCHPHLFRRIWSPGWLLVRSADHAAPDCIVFFFQFPITSFLLDPNVEGFMSAFFRT